MGTRRQKRPKKGRSRQHRQRTWWIAGIGTPMKNGMVALLPPILGIAYNDQDRAMVRAGLASTVWAKALGGNSDSLMRQMTIQALAAKPADAAQIQRELEDQRDHHPNAYARETALIALGQSESAEAIAVPDYIRNLPSARESACRTAEIVEVKLPDKK